MQLLINFIVLRCKINLVLLKVLDRPPRELGKTKMKDDEKNIEKNTKKAKGKEERNQETCLKIILIVSR